MARNSILVRLLGDSRDLERAYQRGALAGAKFSEKTVLQNRTVAASFKEMGVTMQAGIGVGAVVLASRFVEASRNAQTILGQTSVAVKDAGLNWDYYSKSVQEASMRISRSSAFDDEAVLRSFQVFIRGQKDVGRSLELASLAADVARGRYVDLDSATQLVNKAAMGQIGALRRAGIQIDKNATSAEALDALLKAYGGSAKTYADSAAGSSDKLRVAWENLAEQAGGPLSTALAQVAGQLTTIVGLMQKAGGLKFPTAAGFGGGGTVGDLTSKLGGILLTPGRAPLIITKAIYDKIRGGGGGDTAGGRPGGFLDAVAAQIQAALGGATKAGRGAGQAGAGQAALGSIDTITAFIDKWAAVGRKATAVQKAAEAAKRAAANYQTRQETRLGWLEFGLERAEATKKMSDDRTWLKKIEAYYKERIRHEGRKLELVSELWRTQQKIRDLNKKNADADPLAGLMQVSTKQLTNILAAGTGLTGAARGRLAYNIAGAEIVTHTHVHIDGAQVATAVNRHNAKAGRRTAAQTSGRR